MQMSLLDFHTNSLFCFSRRGTSSHSFGIQNIVSSVGITCQKMTNGRGNLTKQLLLGTLRLYHRLGQFCSGPRQVPCVCVTLTLSYLVNCSYRSVVRPHGIPRRKMPHERGYHKHIAVYQRQFGKLWLQKMPFLSPCTFL